jgi:flavodoxin
MIPTVIVYYSKDNNTRTGANILAEKIGAKIVELKEVKKGNFIQALMQKGKVLECHALIGGKMGHFAGEDYIRMQMDKI